MGHPAPRHPASTDRKSSESPVLVEVAAVREPASLVRRIFDRIFRARAFHSIGEQLAHERACEAQRDEMLRLARFG